MTPRLLLKDWQISPSGRVCELKLQSRAALASDKNHSRAAINTPRFTIASPAERFSGFVKLASSREWDVKNEGAK
jgi:hypothetical protein